MKITGVPGVMCAAFLALSLVLSPAIAHPDEDPEDLWSDVVLTKIKDRQYQETVNDPFSNENQADGGEETKPTPTSCIRHPIACVIDLYEKKGLFESTIGGYKRSDSAVDGFLNKNAVFTDANGFVTLSTLIYLMNANQHLGEDISDMLTPAVNAVANFHDQNYPDANLLGFWEQKFVNDFWVTWSNNSTRVAADLNAVEKVLRDACELIFSVKECDSDFPINPYGGAAMYIPSDSDDTSENLSVGAILSERQTDPVYTTAYQAWRASNSPSKVKAALEKIMNYAYDADGESVAHNLISPRTYYFLSEFYEGGAARNTRIPSTWLLDDEQVFNNHYRGRGEWSTPHLSANNVNDIDPILLAHFISAVARLDRSGLLAEAIAGDETFANDLGTIVYNATSYVVHLISRNAPYLRPDILAPYYAYPEQAYESLANVVAETDSYTPHLPRLADAATLARNTMESFGTVQLVANSVEYDPTGDDPQFYWEGILRNREIDGAEVVRDRAFATAAAVSALLDTWTESTPDGGLRWRTDADVFVTDTLVPKAIDFIKKAALDPLRPLTTIAFVGLTSEESSEIYRYPANHYAYLDGEKIDTKDCVVNLCETAVYGVLGFIPRQQYEELLAKGPFDFGPTPTTASDWGTRSGLVVIWRSEAQAYALALKVVAQFEAIEDDAS